MIRVLRRGLVHRATHDATLRGSDEVKDERTLVALGYLLLDHTEGFRIVEPTLVEGAVDIVDTEDLLVGEATTT
mgnify:CR=1 FL=1